jgi:hypothetical protein
MLPNHIYVSHFEATIAGLKEALSLLQTEGLATVAITETTPKPRGAHVVIPADRMSEARICSAALLIQEKLRIPIRASSEKPFGSIEMARARGFSEEVIAKELRPWRAAAITGSEEAVANAEAVLKAAQANLAAAHKQADAPLADGTG